MSLPVLLVQIEPVPVTTAELLLAPTWLPTVAEPLMTVPALVIIRALYGPVSPMIKVAPALVVTPSMVLVVPVSAQAGETNKPASRMIEATTEPFLVTIAFRNDL